MASLISAGTTSGTALNMSGDTSGVLQLASNNGTTALSISTAQVVTLTNALPVTSGGTGVTTSTGTGAVVLGTSPTITTPVISSLSSATATALTLQSAGTTAVTIDTSQNVGIGTTTINNAVTTYRGAGVNNYIQFTNSTTGTASTDGCLIGVAADDTSLRLRVLEAASMIFTTNDTERMRINSAGLVGINKVPNSLAMLEIRAKDGTTQQLFLEQNNTEHGWQFYADQADGYLKFYRRDGSGSTKRFEFQSNGAAYSSTGTWGTLSDARLKENIVDATPKLDAVMQLKVRNYNLIGEDLKQIGFVAQELEQVFPNVAETERNYDGTVKEDGIKSVKTTVLIPILVKAIQELKAINDTQAETINAQSATLVALTARIVAIESRGTV